MVDKPKPEQTNQPKTGEPVETPVPGLGGLIGKLRKAAKDAVVRRTSTSR